MNAFGDILTKLRDSLMQDAAFESEVVGIAPATPPTRKRSISPFDSSKSQEENDLKSSRVDDESMLTS